MIKHGNTVNYIKVQILTWFGHIYRMPYTRTTKKILKWNPLTTDQKEDPRIDGRTISYRTFVK